MGLFVGLRFSVGIVLVFVQFFNSMDLQMRLLSAHTTNRADLPVDEHAQWSSLPDSRRHPDRYR